MKKFFLSLLALVMIFSIATTVSASAKSIDTEKFNEKSVELSQKEIEARKAEIEENMIKNFGLEDNVDKALEELGLEVIETVIEDSEFKPSSLATDTEVTTSYYRDRFSGKYLVRGAWNWKCSNIATCYDQVVTPNDAFGLWMNNVSNGAPATGQTFESYGSAVYATNGEHWPDRMWETDFDPANAGVSWAINDGFTVKSGLTHYLGHSGQAWIWMSKPPTGDVYLRAKYVHTWSSGSITGINISSSGLGFTLGGGAKHFDRVNPVTKISSWPSN